MIGLLLKAGKRNILTVAGMLVLLTALLDWAVGRNVSLAALYILPMMLAAIGAPPVGNRRLRPNLLLPALSLRYRRARPRN